MRGNRVCHRVFKESRPPPQIREGSKGDKREKMETSFVRVNALGRSLPR